jgi:hypothetical protein
MSKIESVNNLYYSLFEEVTNNILFFANSTLFEIRKYSNTTFDYIQIASPWGAYYDEVKLIGRESETSVLI